MEWWQELPATGPVGGNDAPRVEQIGGAWKFRASSVGKCPRALLAEMHGFTPMPSPAYLKAAAKEGHLHEDAIVSDLEEAGYNILTQQEVVELWVTENILVRGHTDGLATYKDSDDQRIVEIKSMSDAQYKLWLKSLDDDGNPTFSEHPAYAWQISCYMLAKELPAVYVVKNRNSGMKKIHWLDTPPRLPEEIVGRLTSVVAAYEGQGPMPDPRALPCDPEVNQFFCPFPDLHDKRDKDLGWEEDDRPIVDVVAAQFQQYSAQAKKIKAAQDALREQLIELVGPSKVQTLSGLKVDIVKTQPRKSLNKDKAEADGVDIDKYYEEGKSKSYRVKVTKDDN